MNSVTAKVILDSVSPEGVRLTTLQLRYPRMVHADFMTHRVFSRNGRSSRAVPVTTLLKEDPYTPHFMKNQPGMVAMEEMSDASRREAEYVWQRLAKQTKEAVSRLNELGVHKQWANRPLEWFGYIDVLVTSTDWANFMALRYEVGAQPEIQELAAAIKEAMEASEPARCPHTAWHLPYIDYAIDTPLAGDYLRERDLDHSGDALMEVLKKISVARCARLTIRPFDGDGSVEKEIARYEKLMVSRPVHASPAEHIATPDRCFGNEIDGHVWSNRKEWGNFYGWRQFRKMIEANTVYDR